MHTRRDFLRHAVAATSGVAILDSALATLARAAAIDPEPGSSWHDAEHVVILMQENRSFDHAFGTLRGVRGFNDPRALTLSDGNPVWVQTDAAGQRHVPFRLDLYQSQITWMGCLPHGWDDQVAAANGGLHDRWLDTKRSSDKKFAAMPLTLGYHTREDIPFYYALADAFTICDQHFCSTLTGTTSNRLHLWTGTNRASPQSPALVHNSQCDYGSWQSWKTFPERLEDAGVSWRIYQNELTVPNGLSGEAESWLANFGDSPLEWFLQYGVRYAERHRQHLARQVEALPGQIDQLRKQLESKSGDDAAKIRKQIDQLIATLERSRKDLAEFSGAMPAKMQRLHERAFTTNAGDPAFRELDAITYKDGDTTRTVNVPKGDVLHQFRQDVENGTLPTVSWLVPPENFSDHPCSAWYGQWYLAEVLAILTRKPEVWRKTIFILNYDENDGFYDHVPPFQAPHPSQSNGKASAGIDTTPDHADWKLNRAQPARSQSLGLGFRVPLIIASPWTRGGCVCSEVFDLTSPIQFLEKFLARKGKTVEETNITRWRRTICGDLTSAFQSAADASAGLKDFPARDAIITAMHKAKFQPLPAGFQALKDGEVAAIRQGDRSRLPKQEPGTRRSSPLPYELAVEGDGDAQEYRLHLTAGKEAFGERSAGAPFIVYAVGAKGLTARHYAVAPGDTLTDAWQRKDFEDGRHHLRVHGPNGFYREFRGSPDDRIFTLKLVTKRRADGLSVTLEAVNGDSKQANTVVIRDNAYGAAEIKFLIPPGARVAIPIDTMMREHWYDFTATVIGSDTLAQRYAGRIETGRWGISDPYMGREVS